MGTFWDAIVTATLLLGAFGAVANHPVLLHSARGLVMGALLLAFLLWYLSFMRMRRRPTWPPWSTPQAYVILSAGLALAAALRTFDLSFIGLLYMLVSLVAAVLPPRRTIAPMIAITLVYLYPYLPGSLPLAPASAFPLLLLLFYLALSMGIAYSMAALFRQRAERDRLIADLQEAHRQLQAAAARDVELAALRERNRLAREMHDSLGHALVLIAVKIEAAQRLQAVDAARAAEEWEDTKALVRSTMADLRNSLAGLRLRALEERSLPDALADLCGEMERRSAVAVTCRVDPAASGLDGAIQEALYRVAQEGLANVSRHAHARHAWLTLTVGAAEALVEIADDGIGLAAALRGGSSDSYGILGMRERVAALDGSLTLGPHQGGGTVLRAYLPLAGRAIAAGARKEG
jgi:signal transduction histidine kinase